MTVKKKSLFDNRDFKQYAKYFVEEVAPMIRGSACTITIAPAKDKVDVKASLELGYSILTDKPLIVIAPPGKHVAEKLLRIADYVIKADISTAEGRAEVEAALKAITNQ